MLEPLPASGARDGLTMFTLCSIRSCSIQAASMEGARCECSPEISAILAICVVGTLLSNSLAAADDYNFDFGAETNRGRDAGTISCRFDHACDGKLEALGLTVRVEISREANLCMLVRLDGDSLDCCYFAGPANSIVVDPKTKSSVAVEGDGIQGRLVHPESTRRYALPKVQFSLR